MTPEYIQDYTRKRPGLLLRFVFLLLDALAGFLAAFAMLLVVLTVRWCCNGLKGGFWPFPMPFLN